ncbi:hypothetical protein KSP39_PZI010080 [Platanthera zijinensis]|uniref:GIR1-like zinc ribbon domain-containing protein n=1 Tax=Platanthera zijinensis TaxID=2320716 RepID=A0AAP0G6S8_9ASPA
MGVPYKYLGTLNCATARQNYARTQATPFSHTSILIKRKAFIRYFLILLPVPFRRAIGNPNPSGGDGGGMSVIASRVSSEDGDVKRDLVTRDLLGGGKAIGDIGDVGMEIVEVAVGWERRIDQLSGKTNLQKTCSDPVLRELHDLNLPPPLSGSSAAPERSTSLDLSLSAVSAAVGSDPASAYRSVCTLEKVKSALKRAEQESLLNRRRRSDCGSSGSTSSSTTSSSLKRRSTEETECAEVQDSPLPSLASGGMVAAGCPVCLLYVLISTVDPRCPRCDSTVPIPLSKKHLRIDLNCSSPQYC